jgi:single-stranded DNA-binding protein
MRLAVRRHARSGRREPGVVYLAVTTFGLEARDCAERLRRGDRIGVTGRIEQDRHRTPEGWQVDHSVLIDQLDLPGITIPPLPTDREDDLARRFQVTLNYVPATAAADAPSPARSRAAR